MHAPSQLVNGLITLAVVALIARRTLRTQTVRVWMLIAVPVILIIVAIGVVVAKPPTSLAANLAVFAGLVCGVALGYARGFHSKVRLGPRPGTLIVRGNVFLVVILVAAFAVRFLVRSFIGNTGLGLALADAFVVLAAVSVAVARGMLFFAWRRLVDTGATSATT